MQLSPRELQIVTLLMQGNSNKEIAQALGLSPHTVRDYISAMLQRFGVASRAALALMFSQQLQTLSVVPPRADRRAGAERRLTPRAAQSRATQP